MQRRTFIGLASAATVGMGLGLNACNRLDPKLAGALARPILLSRICDGKSLAAIGRSYLAAHPKENSRSKLTNALLPGEDLRHEQTTGSIEAMMDKKTVEDFVQHRTVVADGWVIGVTEARQAALFALGQA